MSNCPKCGKHLPEQILQECPYCGVVFSKIRPLRQQQPALGAYRRNDSTAARNPSPLASLLHPTSPRRSAATPASPWGPRASPAGRLARLVTSPFSDRLLAAEDAAPQKEDDQPGFRRIVVEQPKRRVSLFSLVLVLLCWFLLAGIVSVRYFPATHRHFEKILLLGKLLLAFGYVAQSEQQAPESRTVVVRDDNPEQPSAEIMEQIIEKAEKSRETGNRAGKAAQQKTEPPAAAEHIKEGFRLAESRKFYDSLAQFDAALRIEPANPLALKGKGFVEKALGRKGVGISTLERSLEGSEDEDVLLFLAQHYYETGELEKAEKRLQRYLKIRPGNYMASMLMQKLIREKSVEEKFQKKITNHFEIRFDGKENTGIGNDAIRSLEDAYLYLSRELGFRPEGKVQVIIYTEQDFQKALQDTSLSAGRYDGKIRLSVGGIERRNEEFDKVVRHEATHAFMFLMGAAASSPRWFNEGVAMFLEAKGRKEDYLSRYERAVKAGKIQPWPLSELSRACMANHPMTKSLGYAQSASLVHFVVREYGMYDIKRIFSLLADRKQFSQATTQILKEDESSLLEKWKASL